MSMARYGQRGERAPAAPYMAEQWRAIAKQCEQKGKLWPAVASCGREPTESYCTY